jgi:chaperonin GroES
LTASARATRLHDRLLVRRIEAGAGGGEVRVPGTGKGRPWKGRVVAVGDDEVPVPATPPALDVKVGDTVLFGRNSGIEIRVSGEDLLILPEHEFLVVLV